MILIDVGEKIANGWINVKQFLRGATKDFKAETLRSAEKTAEFATTLCVSRRLCGEFS